MELGSWLRMKRNEAGLKLADIAAPTGFTPSYVSQVERNLATPSVAAFKKLANAVGTTVSSYFASVESANGQGTGVVRRGHRKVLLYPGSLIRNELLCPDLSRRVELLEEGDCIYFPSSQPHGWRNAGEGELQAVWMECPPSF